MIREITGMLVAAIAIAKISRKRMRVPDGPKNWDSLMTPSAASPARNSNTVPNPRMNAPVRRPRVA